MLSLVVVVEEEVVVVAGLLGKAEPVAADTQDEDFVTF